MLFSSVRFQSPCGEEGLKDLKAILLLVVLVMLVSIPLRGRGFESRAENAITGQGIEVFQSPCGEEGLKEHLFVTVLPKNGAVSIPLRGRGFESVCDYADCVDVLEFQSPCGEEGLKGFAEGALRGRRSRGQIHGGLKLTA